jgi:carbonic anhydrase
MKSARVRSTGSSPRDRRKAGSVCRHCRLNRQPSAARARVRPADRRHLRRPHRRQLVNSDIIGSLEFATKIAGAKAIVVLGHTEWGAIKGAIDHAKLGNLTKMLENFNPAIEASKSVACERSSTNKKLVQAVADTNAKLAAKMLVDKSDVLRELVEKRQLVTAAAMHDVGTGKVTFFG